MLNRKYCALNICRKVLTKYLCSAGDNICGFSGDASPWLFVEFSFVEFEPAAVDGKLCS